MEPVQMKDTLPADLWTVEVIIRCERENKQFGEDIWKSGEMGEQNWKWNDTNSCARVDYAKLYTFEDPCCVIKKVRMGFLY